MFKFIYLITNAYKWIKKTKAEHNNLIDVKNNCSDMKK
jgi:hypothetical protein